MDPDAAGLHLVRHTARLERGGAPAYLRDALAAADERVDFSRYDVVYFVADPDAPGVDSDATKVVNLDTPLRADGKDIRRVVTVFEKHPPDRLVLAHETGHVFDLPDLYHRPADGKGDWDTYVGDWDLMGSQFGLAPDLFGWHKWKLGWLETRQVACVRGAGGRGTRLTLEPLGAGPGVAAAGSEAFGRAGVPGAGPESEGVGFGSGNGTKLAVVRTGRDSAVAFEARGPVGNDAAVCQQGVLVYRVRGGTAVRRRPDRGRRRAPLVRGLLGRLGLSAARRRAGRARGELHGAGRERTGRGGGPDGFGGVDGDDLDRELTGVSPAAGRHGGHAKGPSLSRGAFHRLCAARDSNPGPAD